MIYLQYNCHRMTAMSMKSPFSVIHIPTKDFFLFISWFIYYSCIFYIFYFRQNTFWDFGYFSLKSLPSKQGNLAIYTYIFIRSVYTHIHTHTHTYTHIHTHTHTHTHIYIYNTHDCYVEKWQLQSFSALDLGQQTRIKHVQDYGTRIKLVQNHTHTYMTIVC